MARTDAHRPYYVLEIDEPQRFQEWHDHRNGICELIPGEASGWYPYRGFCSRVYRGHERICSCSMCSGRYNRRQKRRWFRQVARQLIKDALKMRNWEDVDIWPKHWMEW